MTEETTEIIETQPAPSQMPKCRECKVELTHENWYPSYRKGHKRICKECDNELRRLWRAANPEKTKASYTRSHRNQGQRPYDENKECSQFLGVHIAERVLSHVFQDVEMMPMNHENFDFVCNHGKKIDVKSACFSEEKNPRWGFNIRHNTVADYFLCLAFDNREDLTPMHAWLIPGSAVNHLKKATISPDTVSKWDAYKIDVSNISACCDAMR